MNQAIRLIALTSAVAALSACAHSPVPVAENFALTTQKKVRSAGHWDMLSRDVVSQTKKKLADAGVGATTPLSVVVPPSPSAFDQAFTTFLITELVNGGYHVSVKPDQSTLKISYQTQIIRHESVRPHFVPGSITALTSGLFVAHGLGVHASTGQAMAGALGFAALADLGLSQYSGGPTAHELVLTTMVEGQDRFLVRNSDVYYIENADVSLFAPRGVSVQPIATQNLKVVGQ